MKKLFLAILIFIFCAGFANAATLKWDRVASAPDCNIAGYIVYYGVEEGVYPKNLQGPPSNIASYLYAIDALPPDNTGPTVVYIPGPVTIIVE